MRRHTLTEAARKARFETYRLDWYDLCRLGAEMTLHAEADRPGCRASAEKKYAATLAVIRRKQAAYDTAHPEAA